MTCSVCAVSPANQIDYIGEPLVSRVKTLLWPRLRGKLTDPTTVRDELCASCAYWSFETFAQLCDAVKQA